MMTIAVIDDEESTRKMAGRILSKAGYRVETFAAGSPFLHRMEREPFDIVFLDLQLPDMGDWKSSIISRRSMDRPRPSW